MLETLGVRRVTRVIREAIHGETWRWLGSKLWSGVYARITQLHMVHMPVPGNLEMLPIYGCCIFIFRRCIWLAYVYVGHNSNDILFS